jgi:DNA replication protein DnaC
MLINPTLNRLRELKLTGMADAFAESLEKPLPDLDFESRLSIMIDREYYLRESRRLKRRLTQAKLHQQACVEDIDYQHPRGLDKANFLELTRLQWAHQHLNLLITGKTGCGKTYLACALAHKACLSGLTSKYYRILRLFEELKIAKANGTYASLLSQIAKIDLLILDDWGLSQPDSEQRKDLLEILDDRYQNKSTIITSQLPVLHWHEHLNDATLADAILDRVVHNSIRLELQGESMRKIKKSLQTKNS